MFVPFPNVIQHNLKGFLADKLSKPSQQALTSRLRALAIMPSKYRPAPLMESFIHFIRTETATIPYQTYRRIYEGNGRSILYGGYARDVDLNGSIFRLVFKPIVEEALRNWFDPLVEGLLSIITKGWDGDKEAQLISNRAYVLENVLLEAVVALEGTWDRASPVLEEHMGAVYSQQREVSRGGAVGPGYLKAIKAVMTQFLESSGAGGRPSARAMFLAMVRSADEEFVQRALVVLEWVIASMAQGLDCPSGNVEMANGP